MGYQTDFVGYLQLEPVLNQSEIALVNGISGSIRLGREAGLRLADEQSAAIRLLGAGAPRGWSNWAACSRGCCLSYDGGDKANQMIPWLEYLISALLAPGAVASDVAGLDAFTCDHVLNGVVVGSRRDNRELYAVRVTDNVLAVKMLWRGRPEWSEYPPLAYQDEIDRVRAWIVERRSDGRAGV